MVAGGPDIGAARSHLTFQEALRLGAPRLRVKRDAGPGLWENHAAGQYGCPFELLTGVIMSGPVDPHLYLQQIAVRMKDLTDRKEMETVLDELEYLYDIIDPAMQDGAEALMSQLRKKLGTAA
jgi:hypothetical protein